MLTAGADKKAWVWNTSNGEPKLTLAGHAYGILAAGYSPDGKRIVTGSQDLSAKVWDAATGQELLTLTGHTGQVSSVVFSPDGQCIVTGSADGTARVWTVARPEQVAAWQRERLSASNLLHAALPLGILTEEAKPLAPGLITNWLVLTPTKAQALGATTIVDMEQIPNEARLHPRAKERVLSPKQDLIWEPSEQTGPRLELNMLAGQVPTSNNVAYAVCYLVTEKSHAGVVFHLMADDECKVYLNGQTIHRSRPDRAYILDEETVSGVSLPAGTNTIVFKIVNETEHWIASMRVLDEHGQTLPDLRVTLEPGAAR
jgi:dipeptidyl aminopeptidase/acylaminoacyl peptidase